MSLREPSQNLIPNPSLENCPRKPRISERKIDANRRNAQRSTGPKTARGKQTSARNAIKHGLLAREVVITSGDGKEDLHDFERLMEGLWDDYKPVGTVEESLVQTIGACWWRKARTLRAENGEIRERSDTSIADGMSPELDKANLALFLAGMNVDLFPVDNRADRSVPTADRWSKVQSVSNNLHAHPIGLLFQHALLQVAMDQITSAGSMSEKVHNKLVEINQTSDATFAIALASCRLALSECSQKTKVEGEPSESTENERADEIRRMMASLIEDQLKRTDMRQRDATERHRLRRDAEARRFSLPSTQAADKIIRYETHIDRQLYHAMDELERLQRLRQGEKVPPPLNVNLGREG
jgi:hypothetical protein